MAAGDLPVLIVGDVHGDIERLFEAIKPYPADEWHTIFLGDLVDYGVFGIGALRFAHDRPNTDVLLGNHEVAMLWALRDPSRVGFWMSIGGQQHDLDELRKDEPLQQWMRERRALLELPDRTLIQHCGNDAYADLGRSVEAINEEVRARLNGGGEALLWELLSSPNVFETQHLRLERWLKLTDSRRVVFGHKPMRGRKQRAFHGGTALNFEGAVAPLPN